MTLIIKNFLFKNNFSTYLLLLVNMAIFAYFYLLHHHFPFYADDINISSYEIANSDFSLFKLKSMYQDIIRVRDWNARIGETLLVLFVNLPKHYYNFFGSLVNVLLINMIFFYSFSRLPRVNSLKKTVSDVFYLFIIFSFLFVPYVEKGFLENFVWKGPSLTHTYAFVELFIWAAGALNHTFGNLLLLIVFIPYFYLFYNRSILKNNIPTLLIIIFIYYISFMNSYITILLVLGLMLLSVIVYYLRSKKIELWSITGIIFAILGIITVLSAKQLVLMKTNSIIISIRDILDFYYIIPLMFKLMTLYMLIFSFVYIAICLYYLLKHKKKLYKKAYVYKLALIICLFFANFILLSVASHFVARALILFTILFIVHFCILLDLFINKVKSHYLKYVVIIFIIIVLPIVVLKKTKIIYNHVLATKHMTLITKQEMLKLRELGLNESDKVIFKLPKELKQATSGFLCIYRHPDWCDGVHRRYYNIQPDLQVDIVDNIEELSVIILKKE